MRWILPCLVILAGCDTPHPRFAGVEPVRITVGQSTFDIRVRDRKAEAIRRNAEWAPRPEAVAPRAVAAIERVSGCTVRRLDGDQAQFFAWLKCGRGDRPMEILPGRIEYECDIEDAYVDRGLGETVTGMTCTPRRY
ncbi:MAG: hypothetical protein HLUCCO07_09160 [Rhodobacteraceae bacterium HLUCCO07]|nr:MAG: hypothetical protein HLUCCO07_09160 [Rhodobacteraceae bacterium HLUCCO07]